MLLGMYYRRRILLALIEKFGGKLKSTRFQKLLFLFTRNQKKSCYHFVPYRYGAYSFQARADKSTLIKYGFLKNENDWSLNGTAEYLSTLNETDQSILNSLYNQFHDTPINDLIRYTYVTYPEFAIKSEIMENILPEETQQKIVTLQVPVNHSKKLYTIGYEGISLEEYMNRLIFHDIKMLVDVRKNSISMKYGFSKKQLMNTCEKMGIRFVHIPELGIESDKRKNLNSAEDYRKLFELYENDILPKQSESIKELLMLFQKYERVAITCFEKEHTSCHRHKISDLLNKKYHVPVEHL